MTIFPDGMRFRGCSALACAALAAGLLWSADSNAGRFLAPIDTPAMTAVRPQAAPLIAVTRAGNRVVAVGQRGVVVLSDDVAAWRQVPMPLSSDFTAVSFPTPTTGWIVGQDGVILHSADAGETWVKQTDGMLLPQLMVEYYLTRDASDPRIAKALKDARRMVEDKDYKPLLGVWFDDVSTGFVVGEFGIIYATNDGGKSWKPWYHKINDERGRHLHEIRRIGGELYIAGEQGLLLKFDPQADRFVSMPSPYEGSFMGIFGKPGLLVIYGMRGNAYRSTDHGATWQRMQTNTDALITAGALLDDGRIVLASENGKVLVSADAGKTFVAQQINKPTAWWGAVATPKDIVLVGPAGVRAAGLGENK